MYIERKRKKIRYSLSWKKVRISIGNFGLLAYHTLILFSKIKKFYRVNELSKSNQTRYGVSHVYLERKTKRIFGIACLQKSQFFNRKFRPLRLFYFQKYRNFIGTRNCPKRTKLGIEYPMCTQSVKQKEFLVQLVQKKVRISIGNIDLFAYYTLILFSKIQKFYRVKELSKSNQTRYGVYHVYLERKTKRIFGITRLQKRSFFNRKFRLIRLFYFQKYRTFNGSRNCPKRTKLGVEYPMCTQSVKKVFYEQLVQKKVRISIENIDLFAYYTLILFSKLQNFYRVKELSKSNQTRYGVSHAHLECKTKRIVGIACLQKKSFFNRKFRILRLFYFQNYRNFIGTRNCPKRTKLGMEYPICTQSVKQKDFLVQLVQKKVRLSIENIDLFAYYTLILFSKLQNFYRVKELFKSNQTRYGVSHAHLECKTKRIVGIACLQKSSFFNRKFRPLRLFYFQKYRSFIGTRNCPKRTKLGIEYPMCTQSVKQKEFLVQLVQKKVRISIGNIELFAYYTPILFSKIQKFYRVKELSKSNQTRYGVSCVYLERKTKRIFVIAFLQKNFVFQSEISTYSLIIR